MLYSAADVVATPSRVDNLPQVVLESLCCGTPCVAFHVGGMPDMIEHERTGYLATPYSTDDFAAGIHWALNHGEFGSQISEIAATKWNEDSVGRRYHDLLSNITAHAGN